ncbi:hypothetical protein BOA8489_03880 [Boseongicola aestuarii]|uniref:Uncharacterized protein n=1 Tax=Boseongicola aestuarii TaxID=1470561 RepID=A0A238J4Z9_9RHOB|nr:hypothetical protein BOA8489_03880 [Boseongicola aestuarii]
MVQSLTFLMLVLLPSAIIAGLIIAGIRRKSVFFIGLAAVVSILPLLYFIFFYAIWFLGH